MPIGSISFPELRAPTRVNPISEALEKAVESYYTPQERSAGVGLKQAEANSKNAYANFTAPQIAATLLNSPSLRGVLPTKQIQDLANFASNGLNAGMTRTAANNYNNQPSLIDHMLSAFGINNGGGVAPAAQSPSASQSNEGQAPSNPPQATSNPPDTSSSAADTAAATYGNSITNNAGSAVPSSTIERIGKQTKVPGSEGGVNPVAVNTAQEAGLTSTATGEATANVGQWKDRQDQRAAEAKVASDALIQDANVLNAYDKLGWAERGPYIGKGKAVTTEAQDFDRYASARSTSLSQGLSSGAITERQFDAGQSLKPTRESNKDTVHHAMAFDRGVQMRILQKQAFEQQAQNSGLTPAQSDVLWSRYINEKPFWDSKKEKMLMKNFDYSSYFSPEKLKWAKNPSSINYQSDTGNGVKVNLKGFTNKKHFQSWYNSQTPEIQQAVQDQLSSDEG